MNAATIARVNELAGAWGAAIWRASWQGAIFVFVVYAVCFAFRKLHPAVRYWLWWLAAMQFLARFAFVVPVAVAAPHVAPLVGESNLTAPGPAMRPGESSSVPAAPTWEGSLGARPPDESLWVSTSTRAKVQLSHGSIIAPAAVAMAAWLFGVVGLSVAALRKIRRSHAFVDAATPCNSERIIEVASRICEARNLRMPAIRESDEAPCALLAGWIRPTVVLPTRLDQTLDAAQLQMALTHELTHLRRRDLWSGLAPTVARILFFFHPVVWLCAHEASAACEEACDYEALKSAGGTPAAYARLLLDSARSATSIAALGTALGYRTLHRRISMLNRNQSVTNRRYRTIGIAVVSLLAICALPWSVTAQAAPKPAKPHHATHLKHRAHTKAKPRVTKPKLSVASSPPRMTGIPGPAIAPAPPAPAGLPGGIPAATVAAPAAPGGFGGTIRPGEAYPSIAPAAPGDGVAPGRFEATAPAGVRIGRGSTAPTLASAPRTGGPASHTTRAAKKGTKPGARPTGGGGLNLPTKRPDPTQGGAGFGGAEAITRAAPDGMAFGGGGLNIPPGSPHQDVSDTTSPEVAADGSQECSLIVARDANNPTLWFRSRSIAIPYAKLWSDCSTPPTRIT